ncbi:hypothetical protein POM88_009955 [Heracleum sosnowskyi]|uniref:Nuclear factor related to kappa-B-binding protein second winged helix domain-containing protein n=1 Tax=Heracleum sosnowskyi TaxID=360622 RepID=A0AAD8JCV0_9APIA|nr:hypothetical protein POM88_009955 [Heracleum sosnowskyi]
MEEALRYRTPERAFPYTAHHGTKCTVYPLRTLSGRIGTGTYICTLVRYLHFVVENVSDVQIQQTVSRGLDRLPYETGHVCVIIEKDARWVYLHGDRIDGDSRTMGPVLETREKGLRIIRKMWSSDQEQAK